MRAVQRISRWRCRQSVARGRLYPSEPLDVQYERFTNGLVEQVDWYGYTVCNVSMGRWHYGIGVNMIDDQIEVQELIQAMEDLLPIQAYATPSLSQSLRQRGTAIKANQAVQIDSVFNLGDEGGIACSIGNFQTDAVVVSITHLRFDKSNPLAVRIGAYQTHRSQRIDALVDRPGRPSQAQLAKKLRQRRKSNR